MDAAQLEFDPVLLEPVDVRIAFEHRVLAIAIALRHPGPMLDRETEIARLEKLADWLDAKYETPFGVRIGWDGILGLIPVVGELVTTLIAGFLIVRAALLGVSSSVLLRMGVNVLIDDLIGIFPFFGWIGDFIWKANLKNARLLRSALAEPEQTRRTSTLILGTGAAVVAALVLGLAALVGWGAWKVGHFLIASLSPSFTL